MNTMKSKLHSILLWIVALALIPLIYSIVQSGYNYMLDSDELNHIQLAYLYGHGMQPYLDIYNSVYTPLFGWFLLPFFSFMGFTFGTIAFTRYIMIVLFAIRVGASFLVVKHIFGKRVSFLFLPMFLLDPFVIFSSMQIRPDNLMMTVYSVGLLAYVMAILSPTPKKWFTTGVLLATALLILPKILPSIGLLAIGALVYWWVKKKFTFILPAALGFIAPFLVFILYCLLNGSFNEMVTQAVLEAKAAYSYFPVTIPLGNFYIPNNFFVYGTMGKPLTWFYVWFLPFAGVAGLYTMVMEYLKNRRVNERQTVKLILAASLLAQWGTLFFLQVVFMQHYLPISWLYALFSAVAIDQILTIMGTKVLRIVLFTCFIALIITGYKTNIGRSKADSAYLISTITNRWKQIPEGTLTFPNFLFRPAMYPVTYGYFVGNVPPVILNRLPSITARLEQYKVPYLLIDSYLMSKLPVDVQDYVNQKYDHVSGDNELMTRKP